MNNTTTAARRRPARRAGAIATAIAAATLLAVAAGCSDEQRGDLGEQDTIDALTGRVKDVVEAQGVELDGDLTCSADIADDSAVTTSCDGTATSGATVAGTFDGTADVDAETCTAHLVVLVDGASVTDEADADCFAVD